MIHQIVAPSVGESITEVSILKWTKKSGDVVRPGEVLLEIESDKATVEVAAESQGALKIIKSDGETIPIGELIGTIDDSVSAPAGAVKTSTVAAPASAPTPAPAKSAEISPPPAGSSFSGSSVPVAAGMSPSIRRAIFEGGAPRAVTLPSKATGTATSLTSSAARTGDRRVPMTRLRKTIAERLLAAKQGTALLTTFNEVDMKPVMELRNKYKDAFKAKHGVSLGFMSFFTRACVESLKLFPEVNAFIEGDDVVYHDYQDIGIAVGTDRGLVVPVLRDVQNLGFVGIETGIVELAKKARDGKLGIKEMTGGTFTITNGGVYGSLISTPILNAPQSAILGMHAIQERPVVLDGQIVARPMMYLALSYDHRIIDGKGAVSFLVSVKNLLEHPEKLQLDFIATLS